MGREVSAAAMNLTTHFTLDELTRSQTAIDRGILNLPSTVQRANLKLLADTLEEIREALGHPIKISSAFRSAELNAAVGGAKNSAHLDGLAADFTCPQFGTPLQVAEAIAAMGIKFDQCIHEYGKWVHLGIGGQERGQLLTIDRMGTRTGLWGAR